MMLEALIFSSMKQRNGALHLLKPARTQHKERARLLIAVSLIWLLLNSSFPELEKLGCFET